MAKLLPRKDVVIMGLGWTGSILGQELTAAGLDVLAIERGPWRDTANDFNIGYMPDELRYAIRKDLFLKPADEAMTMRNNVSQTALPMRDYGSFLPGAGVGGAGVHWNGQCWRYDPSDFIAKSHLTQRYGARKIAELQLQDWGVTFDEIEHCYDRYEYLCGTSGKAGVIKGQVQQGGNPFEGSRSREYPNPPLKRPYCASLFEEAARNLGLHPFPTPAANLSRPYVNPLGVAMGECTYCGYCERFGCANYSKSTPQTTILPVLIRKRNFEVRTECEVMKINLHPDGKTAKSVTYLDEKGVECEQPGDLILLCGYGLMNVRMLFLSGIGKPYDPKTGQGTLGRNYCYQTGGGGATLYFDDKRFNPFMGAGALISSAHDFNGDNFDHAHLDFVGGASISSGQTNGRPISGRPTPPGTPRWGSQWKAATAATYGHVMSIGGSGSSYAIRGNYLDLDPTYTDRHGRPLLRITFDFPDNDIRMQNWVGAQVEKIARSLNPKILTTGKASKGWNAVPYQSTHNTGGAVMGADPKTSVVNRYLQSWDVSNLFVLGASAFPQNAAVNPTGTVCALAYWAAEAIRDRYIKSPGALVPA
ncbi:MAG: GMC family oxidoreductase [Alphaproteobacteria bacterium]|nr:GMC family oxidoreductase [Alphaproteobacteria bacterium]